MIFSRLAPRFHAHVDVAIGSTMSASRNRLHCIRSLKEFTVRTVGPRGATTRSFTRARRHAALARGESVGIVGTTAPAIHACAWRRHHHAERRVTVSRGSMAPLRSSAPDSRPSSPAAENIFFTRRAPRPHARADGSAPRRDHRVLGLERFIDAPLRTGLDRHGGRGSRSRSPPPSTPSHPARRDPRGRRRVVPRALRRAHPALRHRRIDRARRVSTRLAGDPPSLQADRLAAQGSIVADGPSDEIIDRYEQQRARHDARSSSLVFVTALAGRTFCEHRRCVRARAAGIRWTFTPMVDIAREPRGTHREGAGEDSASRERAAYVRGFQRKRRARVREQISPCTRRQGGRDLSRREWRGTLSAFTCRRLRGGRCGAAYDVGVQLRQRRAGVREPASPPRRVSAEWRIDAFVVATGPPYPR